MKFLTRQEELVLLAVNKLQDDSYLVPIREHLIRFTKKEWSISSVYVPLNRLEKEGFLRSIVGEPTSKRGGKAIKYYKLTEEGVKALAEVKEIHDSMWRSAGELAYES